MLPLWVRLSSSPPQIIGTPCESSSVAIKLRFCCSRSGDDLGVVGRALDAVVPRLIVVRAVPVVLAVGLVVLLVVADQIVQGEAVMGGDEVDAGVGPAAVALIEIARSRQAVGELGDWPSSPFQ